MKIPSRMGFALLGIVAMVCFGPMASALSRTAGREIEFPKGFDPACAKALTAVVQNTQFQFVSGVVSYWPPDIATRLSYVGSTSVLNEFINAVRSVPGLETRVVLYEGRRDERRSDSLWQLDFNQAHPDRVTIYINVKAEEFRLSELELPSWPARPN